MRAISAIITVKPEHVEDFTSFALSHAEKSKQEEGCLGFDVFRCPDAPEKFYFHETYKDQAAIDSHGKTPHFALFQEKSGLWAVDKDIVIWEPVSR